MYTKVYIACFGALVSFLLINNGFSYSFISTPNKLSDSISLGGRVLDSETRLPIRAQISYEKIPSRDDIGVLYSDSISGEFTLTLTDSSKYKFTIQATSYITAHKFIELLNNDSLNKFMDIYLIPLKVGQVIVMDQIEFEKGKDSILPESFVELDNIYKMLVENPRMEIQLEGHTDNIGSSSANLRLSEKRVISVKEYLINKGIKKSRIGVKAYGGAKPIENNSSEEARRKNRRVEIRIMKS